MPAPGLFCSQSYASTGPLQPGTEPGQNLPGQNQTLFDLPPLPSNPIPTPAMTVHVELLSVLFTIMNSVAQKYHYTSSSSLFEKEKFLELELLDGKGQMFKATNS